MVTVSVSTALSTRLVDRSFFLTQLERRDIHLAAGPQAYLLAMFTVANIARGPTHPKVADHALCWQMIEDGIYLRSTATLETAMPLFDTHGVEFIPIVTLTATGAPEALQGSLHQVDALRAFARALSDTAAEEHS